MAAGDAADGPYSVDVTITDRTNATDVTFNWTIVNGNTTVPTLVNPGTQVNVAGDNVSLQLTASDADSGTTMLL